MAGNTPEEGQKVIADLIFTQVTTDRGATLELGLTANASLVNSSALANVDEPTGTGGYARISLANADWTANTTVANAAQQTFTASGAAFDKAIQGYFLATTGSVPRLLVYEIDPSPPGTINDGDSYKVTPVINIA